MLRTRVIPCLLLKDESLVKTVKFKHPKYIGDPVNTLRIFNELEVDELCILDIQSSLHKTEPNFNLLRQLSNECFMPLSYGGGITKIEHADNLFAIGFEKVVINSVAYRDPGLVRAIADKYGSQSVVVSIDVKKDLFGRYHVYSAGGTVKESVKPEDWIQRMEQAGAGEILLTSIDQEGTWAGFDEKLVQRMAKLVSVPVIANGGAYDLHSIQSVVKNAGASAVALGSMVVYQKKGMGVLVNFPDRSRLENALCEQISRQNLLETSQENIAE